MPAATKKTSICLFTVAIFMSLMASGCGRMVGCDTRLAYAVSFTVLGQSGEPLDVDQVTWTTNDAREGEGDCVFTDRDGGEELCERWVVGPDDFEEHDHEAEFTITVQCGSETKELRVQGEGDYCHWDTRERTITFDDRDNCDEA